MQSRVGGHGCHPKQVDDYFLVYDLNAYLNPESEMVCINFLKSGGQNISVKILIKQLIYSCGRTCSKLPKVNICLILGVDDKILYRVRGSAAYHNAFSTQELIVEILAEHLVA